LLKKVISTDKAKALEGIPYSPAIRIGNFVFTAGQVADDPKADVITQTEQALEKVKSLVEAAGATMENIVKCTIFLANIGDYAAVNEVYGRFFKNGPPARSCVEVSRLVNDLKVEIEAIAYVP